MSDKFDGAIFKSEANVQNIANASVENIFYPEIKKPNKLRNDAPSLNNIYAKYFILQDADTGEIYAKKDENTQVPIASTTKIMSAIVALENYNLDDVVDVKAASTMQNPAIIPTVVNLRVGEKITVFELLNCMLIQSGNDSAYALASLMDETNSGGIDLFVNKMNEKAQNLGLKNSNFKDPAGLNDEGYSTASDLAIITRYALKNLIFLKIVGTTEYTATNVTKTIFHPLVNSNRLVNEYSYSGAIGVKTGFTNKASHCLVGAVTRDEHTLISVILGTNADTVTASANESVKLLDWGFSNIIWN